MDKARIWFLKAAPCPRHCQMATMTSLSDLLAGKSDIHLIEFGGMMIPEYPSLFSVLAQSQQRGKGSSEYGSGGGTTELRSGCGVGTGTGTGTGDNSGSGCEGGRGRVGAGEGAWKGGLGAQTFTAEARDGGAAEGASREGGRGGVGRGGGEGGSCGVIRMRLTLINMTGVISPGRADLKGASTKSEVGQWLKASAAHHGIQLTVEQVGPPSLSPTLSPLSCAAWCAT